MTQDTNTILHTLGKMRLKKSVCLSVEKKASMLKSVFESSNSPAHIVIPRYTHRIPSPFIAMFGRYVLPVFMLFFVGTAFGASLIKKLEVAFSDFNSVKSDIKIAQRSEDLKNSLSETHKDIVALKASDVVSDKTDLVNSVTTHSREIRNQVASLVKENKITEAKQIVLTLETALKADELYKVATSVSHEVFETTDLRLELERKETAASVAEASSSTSTTIQDIEARLDLDKKSLAGMEVNASTTDMIIDATGFLAKSEEYIKVGDVENAIISLQAHDRTVAEIKLILLP